MDEREGRECVAGAEEEQQLDDSSSSSSSCLSDRRWGEEENAGRLAWDALLPSSDDDM